MGGSFQSKGKQTGVCPWNLGLSSGLLAYQLCQGICKIVFRLGDMIKNTAHDPDRQPGLDNLKTVKTQEFWLAKEELDEDGKDLYPSPDLNESEGMF